MHYFPAYGEYCVVYTASTLQSSGEFGTTCSPDLMTWASPSYISVSSVGTIPWAPEYFCQPATGQSSCTATSGQWYVFVSLIPTSSSTRSLYYATLTNNNPLTPTFGTWTPVAGDWSTSGYPSNYIDPFPFIPSTGTYAGQCVLWFAGFTSGTSDEAVGYATAPTCAGTFTVQEYGNWNSWGYYHEGESVTTMQNGDLILYIDDDQNSPTYYMSYSISTDGGATWSALTEITDPPAGIRHGTAVRYNDLAVETQAHTQFDVGIGPKTFIGNNTSSYTQDNHAYLFGGDLGFNRNPRNGVLASPTIGAFNWVHYTSSVASNDCLRLEYYAAGSATSASPTGDFYSMCGDLSTTFGYTQKFNGEVAINDFLMMNPVNTATSSNNYNSQGSFWSGSYWNGTAATVDWWQCNDILGSGTTPTTTFSCTHSAGSSGTQFWNIGDATFTLPTSALSYTLPTISTAISGIESTVTTVTLSNSWTNFNSGSGYALTGYWTSSNGTVVHLQGFLTGGSGTSATVFTLPSALWPVRAHYFITDGHTASAVVPCEVGVTTAGIVEITNYSTCQAASGWAGLDGIEFQLAY